MRVVTLGTDGLVDYVETPEGQRYTLGPVSILRVVTEFVRDRTRQRRVLDEFNKHGTAVVSLDLDRLLDALVPVRRRWAASPLIPSGDRIMNPAQHISDKIALTEQYLGGIARGVQAGVAPSVDTLKTLHRHVASIKLPDFGDQSKNDAFMGLGQPKVDTVPDGGWTPPKSVTHPTPGKAASEASLGVLEQNVALAEDTLGKIADTLAKVAQIEATRKASGKGGFNGARAKADLHMLAARVAKIASEVDMAQPYVATELGSLAADTAKIHSVFFPSGK